MKVCWDWESAAAKGEPVPEELGLLDKLAYISMRGVYAQYRAGGLTEEQARQEKAEIRKLHQESADVIDARTAILDVTETMLADTAELRRRIRTAKTAVDVALLGLSLCAVMDGRATVTGYDAYAKAYRLLSMDEPPPGQIAL